MVYFNNSHNSIINTAILSRVFFNASSNNKLVY